MQGKVLATWMKKLQDEFVIRMAALEADSTPAAEQEEQEDAIIDQSTPGQASSPEELHYSIEEHPQQRYMMSGALQSEPSGDEGEST